MTQINVTYFPQLVSGFLWCAYKDPKMPRFGSQRPHCGVRAHLLNLLFDSYKNVGIFLLVSHMQWVGTCLHTTSVKGQFLINTSTSLLHNSAADTFAVRLLFQYPS